MEEVSSCFLSVFYICFIFYKMKRGEKKRRNTGGEVEFHSVFYSVFYTVFMLVFIFLQERGRGDGVIERHRKKEGGETWGKFHPVFVLFFSFFLFLFFNQRGEEGGRRDMRGGEEGRDFILFFVLFFVLFFMYIFIFL